MSAPRLKILLAEDDELLRGVLTRLLEARGHSVTPRQCGLRTLRTLQDRAFDLLIMDLHLPGLSGEELLARIRQLGINVRVLIVSGVDPGDETLRYYPFLLKPFTTGELFQKLEQVF